MYDYDSKDVAAHSRCLLNYGEHWHAAAYTLGRLAERGDVQAIDALIEALKDEHWDIRGAAAQQFPSRTCGDARAVEPLIEMWKNESSSSALNLACFALGSIGDVRAVEPMIEALKDETWERKSGAAKILGKLGDVRAVEPLIEAALLKHGLDEDHLTRAAAIDALAVLRDVRAVEPLIELLKDESEWVRDTAADSLEQLGVDAEKAAAEVAAADMDKIRSEIEREIRQSGDSSFLMQDSAIAGDSMVGSTKIENQVINDPEAIARAAIEAYRIAKNEDED